ncbi:5-(carboxyamino)imidazole ribonucleotide synthase [Rhodophyticola porphyridii]|uniref:5-(carboxyamino)imidazole ribonucleotide synthase n=1 Tax=Rhodophyticola porphyridii TaxID=1852017 RepID=UPI0035D00001
MTEPLPQGSTVGILGGGQLGRMLAMAAARLGYKAHIYEPGAAPAADVAAAWTKAAYDDIDALRVFAASCDVVSFEFENIPASALDHLARDAALYPDRRALEVSQDRLAEKTFLTGLGLRTAPFAPVGTAADLPEALAVTGTPAILKTRRFGYDGKGQARIATPDQAEGAMATFNGAPAIAEGFVAFSCEISVIAARGLDGSIAAYDPGENVHQDGILATTTVPAAIPASLKTDAILIASRILNALEYTGVLGVELFVTPDGLVVNEIAPRVHNSGHWTQAGCAVDQFEQHIRAITGWPLDDGARHANVVMENLIGDQIDEGRRHAAEPGTQIHLYGKAETRPGRKMGHVNRVTGPA